RNSFLQGAALLVTQEHRGPAVPPADPGNQRGVVGGESVAVKLDEIRRQALDVVERVRTVRVARQLHDLPDAHAAHSSRTRASSRLRSVREATRSTCPCASWKSAL